MDFSALIMQIDNILWATPLIILTFGLALVYCIAIKFGNDKYQFLSLLDEAINLDEIVPVSFISHFYASTGRPRKHQLYPMLKALLIQRIFSIPTDTLLIVFLKFSQELRDFCGFDVVPDGSKFTRFKQDFLSDLQSMFDHLVDLTEPICQSLDPALASMTIFDTSGIEA